MPAPWPPYSFPFFPLVAGYPTSGAGAFNTTSINANTVRVGWGFQVPPDVRTAITKILFRYGARTGTPPTYRGSLQALDASGHPDGTVLGGGSPASATFTPPADTTWNGLVQVLTLANGYLPTPGQFLGIAIEHSSGSVDASNFSSFTRNNDSWSNASRLGFPCAKAYSGGSWTNSTGSFPLYGFGTQDGRYWGFLQQTALTTTLGTNGNRAALRFIAPAGSCESYSFSGLRLAMTGAAAGNTFSAGIWDQAGNALATSGTVDSDVFVSGSSRYHEYFFTKRAELRPGVPYYLGIERTNITLDVIGLTVSAADHLSALNGSDDLTLATWNGSAWTVTTTSRPCIEPTGIQVRYRRRLRGGRIGELR
jgi:hypothetical protein